MRTIKEDIVSPTGVRKDIYNLIKQVNENHKPVVINGKSEDNSAVLVSKEDWDSIQETLYLESTGVMNKVREREQDNSGFTNADDIDWDNLDD
ncbi:type II toxin-antitoxin system Phd/YefM family antitoxin [Staphylococcus gallinarum]|uniref:type II toxin-antitoxin system Phd/YefM family antitoxin n=1 Tax=Staphylococcus gallinarum TaxID=1293 RepID=UPI000D1DD78A|nr:type II toxin-antitoxin system Phd/YefM family antitoxin [Staphylococcus gallinarum]PTK89536.1 prevent-host-death protein [Staphylococcus gallinarum]PTK92615.1 prevent-host-death protein [Staphylococcus gallinarum]RIO86099.1 type II toxin-antitoxin system Phd/YefM family antitoxin [Staphylococcus gallinarum]